jgi:iron complex transport system ATP-binding protein
LLAATDVHFAYGEAPVLRGVSVAVSPPALVGVIGPNGSGKTTLVRVLAGHVRPQTGRVTLDGRDLRSFARAALARRLAVVPQETQLAFDYTVLELVLMGRSPHLGAFELEGPRDLAIAYAALEATHTRALARRPFATLSGGEKQRVVIASALAQLDAAGATAPPGRILLLDEPTASLDIGAALDVAALIARLWRERGLGIVVSTHDLNFAAALCQELVLLRDGTVIAAGPTAEVLTREHVRALYGVEAEVARHPRTGHLTVVPIARAGAPAAAPLAQP